MKRARKRSWLHLAFRAFRKGQRESMQAVRRHNAAMRGDAVKTRPKP